MSRGEYRPIHTVLADSPEFQALSKDARLLLYTFKMSMGPSGIDVLYADQLCHRSGLTREEFEDGLQELVEHKWIHRERQVFWLRNGLRFEPRLSHKNEKHRKGVQTHVQGLPKLTIVNEFARYYSRWFPDGIPFPELRETKGSGKAFDSLSEGSRNRETDNRERDTEREREEVLGVSTLLPEQPPRTTRETGRQEGVDPEDLNRHRIEDRAAILEHWHLGTSTVTIDGKEISMELEMHIRDTVLIPTYGAEAVHGALPLIRQVEEFPEDQPVSLRVAEQRPEVMNRLVAAWEEQQPVSEFANDVSEGVG